MTQASAGRTKTRDRQTALNTGDAIPPLENGDRLSQPEFHERYLAMPHIKKAELTEGVVYMPSPVRHKKHSEPHAAIVAWLSDYWLATPGVDLGIETKFC